MMIQVGHGCLKINVFFSGYEKSDPRLAATFLPKPAKIMDNMIEPHKNVKTYPMTSMYGMFTHIYHKIHYKCSIM